MKKIVTTIIDSIQAVCLIAVALGFSMLFRVHQPVGWWEADPPDGIFHREYHDQLVKALIITVIGCTVLGVIVFKKKRRK